MFRLIHQVKLMITLKLPTKQPLKQKRVKKKKSRKFSMEAPKVRGEGVGSGMCYCQIMYQGGLQLVFTSIILQGTYSHDKIHK